MPDRRRPSSQNLSQPDISLNPSHEIYRLQDQLATIDRDVARLKRQVAATGSPIHRIALVATCAARRATAGAIDCWTDILASQDHAVAA